MRNLSVSCTAPKEKKREMRIISSHRRKKVQRALHSNVYQMYSYLNMVSLPQAWNCCGPYTLQRGPIFHMIAASDLFPTFFLKKVDSSAYYHNSRINSAQFYFAAKQNSNQALSCFSALASISSCCFVLQR